MNDELKYLRELKEPQWIGEDGEMAVACKTQRGAWIKFRQYMRQEVTDFDATDIELNEVSIGYLHSTNELTEKEREEMDCRPNDWYVSWAKDAKNNNPVWVLMQ